MITSNGQTVRIIPVSLSGAADVSPEIKFYAQAENPARSLFRLLSSDISGATVLAKKGGGAFVDLSFFDLDLADTIGGAAAEITVKVQAPGTVTGVLRLALLLGFSSGSPAKWV